MKASLRSQMSTITAVILSTTAVAITPFGHPVATQALSSTERAAVELAAFDSPIDALVDTTQLALHYAFTGTYSADPAINWGVAAGIGDEWNALLTLTHDDVQGFLPHITAVGVVPNFLQDPFPIATQAIHNLIGYTELLFQPNGLTIIANNMAAKMAAVVAAVDRIFPEWVANMSYQTSILNASVANAAASITEALLSGDIDGTWNAVVSTLLSPNGVAGTMLNLTVGAGVQTDPTDPTTFVPSVRTQLQTAGQELSSALAESAANSPTEAAQTAAPKVAAPVAAVASASASARAVSTDDIATSHSATTRRAAISEHKPTAISELKPTAISELKPTAISAPKPTAKRAPRSAAAATTAEN